MHRATSIALRSRCLLRAPQTSRAFSTQSGLRSADHGNHYDPPSGWLFGVKPGQKYVKEGWENIWYFGFIGSLVAAGVAYVFKPDTS
jgi:ESSS subunit of NADH:ubiquinone oxidoreductase (complex I)